MAYALHVTLEFSTRKYGIKIGEGEVTALPATLDHSIAAALEDMVMGEPIRYHHRSTSKVIYPLSTVPAAWIESWLGTEITITTNPTVAEFMEFFNENVPQFRDKMRKSLEFIGENG